MMRLRARLRGLKWKPLFIIIKYRQHIPAALLDRTAPSAVAMALAARFSARSGGIVQLAR